MVAQNLVFRTLRFLLPAMAFVLHPAPASAQEDTQKVRARIEAFADAFRDADSAVLERMLTPHYVHTNAGAAPLSREQWLGYISSRKRELASGQLRLSRYENQDVAIVVYGNTAVVTGVNLSEGIHQGNPFSRRLRFTQVWVKTGGEWQRAAFHDAETSP